MTIGFSKDIYFHDNTDNLRYEIWRTTPTASGGGTYANKYKLLETVLGGDAIASKTAKVSGTGQVGNEFTLELEEIKPYQTIVVFASGKICNRSDYSTNYRLTLTFDPTLKTSDYRNGVFASTGQPGFTYKWEEVKN